MKKIKAYLRNKNPYLLASAAIVVLSIGLIISLLYGEPAEEKEHLAVTEAVQEEIPEATLVESQESEILSDNKETEMVTEEIEWKEEVEETIEHGMKSESLDKTDESNEQIEIPEEKTVTKETSEPTIESVPETDKEEHDENLENAPVKGPDNTLETEATETPAPEAHEHSWIFDSFYQEPTCSNGGLVNQICAHCGATQTTGGVPTGEHSYETETPGDCCSAEVVICTDCNHREVREKDLMNHIDVEDGFCYGCGQKTE